jgi:hypothetical protein
VRLALKDGVNRGVPYWVTALQLAEAWGCHPQDIMDRPGGLRWAHRYVFYKKQQRWVDEQNAKT